MSSVEKQSGGEMTTIIISSVILAINIILWILVIRVIKKAFSVDGAIEKVRSELDELVKEIDYTTAKDVDLINAKRNELNSLIEKTDKKIQFLSNEISKSEMELNALKQMSDQTKSTVSTTESVEEAKNPSGKRSSRNTSKVAAKAAQAYSNNAAKPKKTAEESNYQLFAENAGTSDFHRDIKVFDMPMNDGERVDSVKSEEKKGGKDEFLESNTGLKIKIADEPIKPMAVTGNQIVDLAEQGFESEFIAKKLGISIAEVEMTMAFNGKI